MTIQEITNKYPSKETWDEYRRDYPSVDPRTVLSMSRNVAIYNEASGEIDTIYDVVIVVREYQFLIDGLIQYADVGEEKAAEYLIEAGNEVFNRWLLLAKYFMSSDKEKVSKEIWSYDYNNSQKFKLPDVSGAPHITVFGGVADEVGRYISLTVTDKTNLLLTKKELDLFKVFYDNVTVSSNNLDLNHLGEKPYRKTMTSEELSKKPKATKKTSTKPNPSVSPKKTAKIVTLETMAEIKNLPENTTFSIPVWKVYLKEGKEGKNNLLVFNGYTKSINGEIIQETRESIYTAEGMKGYQTIKSQIDEICQNADFSQVDFGQLGKKVVIMATKKISKTGNAYYDGLEIVS